MRAVHRLVRALLKKVFFQPSQQPADAPEKSGRRGTAGILLLRFFMELAAAAYYLTRYPGGLRKAGSVFRAMGEAMLLIPETLRKRRRVQSMRTVGEHAIFSRMPFFQLLRR